MPPPRWANASLSTSEQPHFEFGKAGTVEVQGLTVWEVRRRETATPPLWSQPISGSFWLSTGPVVRSTIAVSGKAAFSDEMTAGNRFDPAAALSFQARRISIP